METINTELFNENLLITQEYCHLQLQNKAEHVASALRTINHYNKEELFSYQLLSGNEHFKSFFSTKWRNDPIFSYDSSLYDKLFDSQMVYKKNAVDKITFSAAELNGKILISEIDMTVVDGASEAMSEGLFDLNDCPPIDTWFYMTRNEHSKLLFAWIPESFIKLAKEAVAVNCIDCIYWYEEYDF